MDKRITLTDKAPTPLGPYSQAVVSGGFVFISGQGPVDPATGKPVGGGIEEQTQRTLQNIKAILEASGSSFEDVVKVTVYLKNAGDFKAMNSVYSKFVGSQPPARATVVAGMVSPDWLIEVEAVAKIQHA